MCLKIIQTCLPKAFDPESFLQNPLLGKVLIETVEKAQSLYTCFFLRSVRWFGDSDKCCYKCSATTYPSHTPYSHDESLSRYPKSSCATWWGTDYHCHITSHTPCNSWWNCRPKTTLVAYWRGKFCLINNYFPWVCFGYGMVDSHQGV